MANTHEGGKKCAAKMIGVTLDVYLAHFDAGESWCSKGKHWQPIKAFGKDKGRWNGFAHVCRKCRYVRTTIGPSKIERRTKRLSGLVWCRLCMDWLPIAQMHAGLCRNHTNEIARKRYATDTLYRAERRQHAHSRKRGIMPIPANAQEHILDDFNHTCAYCAMPATTWDHIVPISKGGQTVPGNVVPACTSCNSSKNNTDLEEWLKKTDRSLKPEVLDRIALLYVP